MERVLDKDVVGEVYSGGIIKTWEEEGGDDVCEKEYGWGGKWD